MRRHLGAWLLAAVAVALSGCVIVPGGQDETATPSAATPSVTPTTPAAETETPETNAEAPCEAGDYDCAMQERDRFMAEQQLPTDGTPLVAVTPEQQEFIGNQRAHIESQGGTWTPQDESIVLALTADACESAILNFHQTDSSVLSMHVASSPIFQQLIPAEASEAEQLQAQASMADIMIYGMQFMCPDDFADWATAFEELYPDY